MSDVPLSLIEDVKNNVPGAFEQLIARMETRINSMVRYGYRFLRVTSCGSDMKEDMMQEALLALWQAVKSFDSKRSDNFVEYAQWFVWGRLRHYLERMRRSYQREWPHDGLSLINHLFKTSVLQADEMNDHLMMSLHLLPAKERRAVLAYILTGRFKDAAKILGVSKPTARKQILHALIGLQLYQHNKVSGADDHGRKETE